MRILVTLGAVLVFLLSLTGCSVGYETRLHNWVVDIAHWQQKYYPNGTDSSLVGVDAEMMRNDFTKLRDRLSRMNPPDPAAAHHQELLDYMARANQAVAYLTEGIEQGNPLKVAGGHSIFDDIGLPATIAGNYFLKIQVDLMS